MKSQSSRIKMLIASLKTKIVENGYIKRHRRYFNVGVMLLIIGSLWFVYDKFIEYINRVSAPTAPVIVAPVIQKKVAVEITGNGSIQPYATVTIKPQVDGIIEKVSFKEGQDIRAGDLLFTIDPRPFQVQLQQARANLARDKALLINTQKDMARYEKLSKKGYVSEENYESLRSTADSQQAVLQADEAAIAAVQLQLDYCYIRSPISGRSGAILVQEGNLVKVNESKTLVVINQIDPISATFSLPEQHLPQLQRRMAAGPVSVIATPQDKSFLEMGELTFIDNTIDPSTGSFQLKANFKNPRRTLWPGQFVNLKLTLYEIPNAIVVPSQAIQIGQKGPYVFVITPDKEAEFRTIIPGPTVKEGTVIEKGVKPGEQVVIDGQFRLTSGKKVDALLAPVSMDNTK